VSIPAVEWRDDMSGSRPFSEEAIKEVAPTADCCPAKPLSFFFRWMRIEEVGGGAGGGGGESSIIPQVFPRSCNM